MSNVHFVKKVTINDLRIISKQYAHVKFQSNLHKTVVQLHTQDTYYLRGREARRKDGRNAEYCVPSIIFEKAEDNKVVVN